MKKLFILLTVAVILFAVSPVTFSAAPKDAELRKKVTTQLQTSRRYLSDAVRSICETKPEVCKPQSSRLQLGCPGKPQCKLPRNPEEVLGHAACIEKWLLGCI